MLLFSQWRILADEMAVWNKYQQISRNGDEKPIDEAINRFGSESARVASASPSLWSKFTPNPTSTSAFPQTRPTQREGGNTQLCEIYIIGWVRADILAACKFGKSVFRSRLVYPIRSRYHEYSNAD